MENKKENASKKETLMSKGLGAEARRKLHDDERYS
jgi:hypothetical protein